MILDKNLEKNSSNLQCFSFAISALFNHYMPPAQGARSLLACFCLATQYLAPFVPKNEI